MSKSLLFLVLAGVACAQTFPAPAIRGGYRFVHLVVKGTSPGSREVRNLGGTLTFDGQGGVQISGRVGKNKAAAQDLHGSGSYKVTPEAALVTVTYASQSGGPLVLHYNDSADVLLGASNDPTAATFDLFVAVRAATGALSAGTLLGNYGGAYFLVRDGDGTGLVTAFLEMTADGAGTFSNASSVGHAAGIDDVNRAEKTPKATYRLNADGSGVATFPTPSDNISGDKSIFVSQAGDIVIGYSEQEGKRDILIAVRKQPDTGTISFRGLYWIGELFADDDYVFQPSAARFGSSVGTLRTDGGGTAQVSERVLGPSKRTNLTTLNSFSIGQGASTMAQRLKQGTDNFAFAEAAGVFVGAQVGVAGQLMLDHGIFFGVRAPGAGAPGPFVSPFGVTNAATLAPSPLAPGEVAALFGSGLSGNSTSASGTPLPEELGGVKVLVNGQPAGLLQVSDQQVSFQVPDSIAPPTATVQVSNNGKLSNVVNVDVAATSPGVFSLNQSGAGSALVTHADFSLVSAQSPATPGETVVVFATGLGAVKSGVAGTPAASSAALDRLFAGGLRLLSQARPKAGAAPQAAISRVTDPNLRVLFDGKPGAVSFAGLVPGFTGLYQVNVTIPADVSKLPATPLGVGTSDAFTDLTEIPIQASR